MTSVAIGIVSFNGGHLLTQCLQHIAAQTRLPDRLIVIDNASTDEETLGLLNLIDGAEVVRLDANEGYGAALNRVAAMVTDFDYFCCLNQDAYPSATWLASLLDAAEQHPKCGSFAPLMLSTDDAGRIDGAGDVLHFTGLPWRRFHGKQLSNLVLKTEPVFSACGGAVMYALPAYQEAGGFDESFFMYVEDIDLGFRLQNLGFPCLFVHDAVVGHVGSATTGYRSDFSVYYGHRNLIWCYFKNMPALLLALMLPFHLLMTLATLVLLTGRGQFKTGLRSKYDGYRRAWHFLKQPSKASTATVWGMLEKRFNK